MSARVIEMVLRGRLSPELIYALEGFGVRTDDQGLTRVAGQVDDQARLMGLLDLFANLHIEVVSMSAVEPTPASSDDDPAAHDTGAHDTGDPS